ncbi:30S ribosomal protein S15 [Candidatus Cyrtobacter comes]|uniref:Small ribosomal subunit protein uS15 n=1 Tax=Candidatus Cyrtobacter comes TaxID=675776 RepID=A0ABU5L6D4_9RICK|nr:30S ribosomal protein S15 [Candidatus Cyrtobacter comes]MDZ5761678.1 30S ribosomal protein S15 [Candidatus Cyrtobacter comes]
MSNVKMHKAELIQEFSKAGSGSVEAQCAIFSERIRNLAMHYKSHPKDHQAVRELLRVVNKRKALLTYLSKRSAGRYQDLVERLGLRK